MNLEVKLISLSTSTRPRESTNSLVSIKVPSLNNDAIDIIGWLTCEEIRQWVGSGGGGDSLGYRIVA